MPTSTVQWHSCSGGTLQYYRSLASSKRYNINCNGTMLCSAVVWRNAEENWQEGKWRETDAEENWQNGRMAEAELTECSRKTDTT